MGKVVEHLPSKHWALSSSHYSQKNFLSLSIFLKEYIQMANKYMKKMLSEIIPPYSVYSGYYQKMRSAGKNLHNTGSHYEKQLKVPPKKQKYNYCANQQSSA
jgi:hypothetical protein